MACHARLTVAAATIALLRADASPIVRMLPGPSSGAPIDPYPYLNGGNFSRPQLPYTSDPLGGYVWAPSFVANGSLQVIYMLPSAVELMPGTPPGSFIGYETLTAPNPSVVVTGSGALRLDYPLELAAWLEFDSPDLVSAAAVTLAVSEYNEFEITNLGAKVAAPVPHVRGGNVTTWRLEINPGLFEGVAFGWLAVNATPSTPWHITALRLVCQVRPANWGGAFDASGDVLLSRIWYAGAYTVKANLLPDQFGSILIYRGDRFSWTGDAHVAQATALVSLQEAHALVKMNLLFTQSNCNGIESYCLYFVLSVCDYWAASADHATVMALLTNVGAKLEHAHELWGTRAKLGFIGWDDRTGSGFANSTADEAEAVYRFLAMRAWRDWAGVLTGVGLNANATHFMSYYNAALNATRNDSGWSDRLGIFAAADALTASVPSPAETQALVSRLFNDSVTICGLSNFNTYFVLKALSTIGELDRGYAALHHCWDVVIDLGGTTVWETSRPYWTSMLGIHDGVPGFEDGFTSLAHPWASGATAWASAWLLGIRPLAAGYKRVLVAPHIAGTMRGVSGALPTVLGPIDVNVSCAGNGVAVPRLHVRLPATSEGGVVRISPLFAARLFGLVAWPVSHHNSAVLEALHVNLTVGPGACGGAEALLASASSMILDVEFATVGGAPAFPGDVHPTAISIAVEIAIPSGCAIVELLRPPQARTVLAAAGTHATALPVSPNPFPAPYYPAAFIGRDDSTAGSWIGSYGAAGYFLVAFDGADKHVVSLPPWIASVQQAFGSAENGPWPTANNDTRALQDPRDPNGVRKIGQFCVVPPPASGWQPSFPIDVHLTAAAEGTMTYQLAVYVVDFDRRGRRQVVTLLDRETFSEISPGQLVHNFEGGVWLVWQYSRSVRLRFNWLRGDNQVISALAFDAVPQSVPSITV